MGIDQTPVSCFLSLQKYCLLYLLEVSPPAVIAHYTAVYTKEILFIELLLGLLLPSVLQNIWTKISSLFVINLELILDYVFRICTYIACAKEQVASQLLK